MSSSAADPGLSILAVMEPAVWERNGHTEADQDQDASIEESYEGPTFMDVIPWEDVLYRYVMPRLTLPELFWLRCCSHQANLCVDQYFTCCRGLSLVHVSSRVTPATFRLMTPGNASLQQLVVRNCKWLTDALLVPALDPAHQLHTLDLSNCTGLGNASLQKVAVSCPNLAVLLLRDCHWVSTDGMLVVSLHCRSLLRLDITACWEIDDNSVITLVKMCDKLQYLSIAKIYGITDRCIRYLAQCTPNLTHLNIQGCWRVTDDSVRFLGEYCPKLRALQVRECREITEASLARLRFLGFKIDVPPHNWTYAYLRKINLQI